jgi:hypothetical protein
MTKLFSLLAVLAIASPVLAEDPKVTFSGLVDTYFSYNVTNSSNAAAGMGNGVLYGFNTMDSTYTLGLAELGAKVVAGEATVNVLLATGEAADVLSLTLPYQQQWGDVHVMAANLALTKDIWTFTFGKFMTWMGNEVVESKANMNYSRSILFFGIPLYHMGFSIGVAPDSQFGASVFVTNGWNRDYAYAVDTTNDPVAPFGGEKTFGLQAKFAPADTGFTAVLNTIYGPEPYTGLVDLPSFVGELILSYTVDKFTFALDSQIGMTMPVEDTYGAGPHPHYYGFALYGKVALEQGWGIALRLEEVVDHGSFLLTGAGTDLIGYEFREATLTVENQLTPNVLARLEGRLDMDVMDGNNLPVYAGGEESQITATGSMVFSF